MFVGTERFLVSAAMKTRLRRVSDPSRRGSKSGAVAEEEVVAEVVDFIGLREGVFGSSCGVCWCPLSKNILTFIPTCHQQRHASMRAALDIWISFYQHDTW